MHLVTGWIEPKSGILISIEPEALNKILPYRQTSPDRDEAGGLLLGLRRGRNIEIKWITVPQKTDTRWRFGFLREALGHAAEAVERWMASGSTADYVGEWHTHPEGIPNPSGTDVSEWIRLNESRKDGTALFFLISGTEGYYACLVNNGTIYPMKPLEIHDMQT